MEPCSASLLSLHISLLSKVRLNILSCHEVVLILLFLVINGENAVHNSEKFLAMARRTRQEYLKELVNSTAGSTSLESASKLSESCAISVDGFFTSFVFFFFQVNSHSEVEGGKSGRKSEQFLMCLLLVV
jgi:hypothetical protein